LNNFTPQYAKNIILIIYIKLIFKSNALKQVDTANTLIASSSIRPRRPVGPKNLYNVFGVAQSGIETTTSRSQATLRLTVLFEEFASESWYLTRQVGPQYKLVPQDQSPPTKTSNTTTITHIYVTGKHKMRSKLNLKSLNMIYLGL